MPTLRQIFGHAVPTEDDKYVVVHDKRPKQCTHIDNVEELPFIKRCKSTKMHNLVVCKDHAYTINYLDGRGIEHTAYFDTEGKAEYFRVRNNWIETNYVIPEVRALREAQA